MVYGFIPTESKNKGPGRKPGPSFLSSLALVLAFMVSFPLLTMWSLNTLFDAGIPYTVSAYGAMLWLGLIVVVILRISFTVVRNGG